MPVEWGEPPPTKRGGRPSEEWQEIADALRTRPGTWALVVRDKSGETATRIKNGTLMAFRPAGTFEARTANRGAYESGQRCDIYARYVGDGRE